MKVTLKTKRLLLRPWKRNDAKAMFLNWASDPEVTKYLTWNPHTNVKQTEEIIKTWLSQYRWPERINFAIVLKETKELIGAIDVVGYLEGTPIIGYCLSKKYWNNGYMTEACRSVLDHLFSKGYKEVRIDAMPENIGSCRVIEKCGGIFIRNEECEWPNKNEKVIVNVYSVKANL